jgi:ribonucleoside-triphosphate reductase
MVKTARTLADVEADIARTKEALANVKGTETEVYARIVGYYRSVRNWNKGKRDEYNHRKLFVYDNTENRIPTEAKTVAQAECAKTVVSDAAAVSYELFTRKTCPNCPPVKDYMAGVEMNGVNIDVDSEEGLARAAELGVFAAPTVIFYDENGAETARAHSVKELKTILKATALPVSA